MDAQNCIMSRRTILTRPDCPNFCTRNPFSPDGIPDHLPLQSHILLLTLLIFVHAPELGKSTVPSDVLKAQADMDDIASCAFMKHQPLMVIPLGTGFEAVQDVPRVAWAVARGGRLRV